MRTIIFINNKGGVGKTATATNVAHMLAQVCGKKVLLIDLDPQMNSTTMFSKIDFINLFMDIEDGSINSRKEKTVENILLDPEMDPHEAIIKTSYEGLDLLPSRLSLSMIETQMLSNVTSVQQFILKDQLDKVRSEYDYCVIDTSPSMSLINVNGLMASDVVYIPMTADGGAMLGLGNTMNAIRKMRRSTDLKIGGIIFTRFDTRKTVSHDMYSIVQSVYENETIPYRFPVSKLVEEGSVEQLPLLVKDPNAKEKVTQEYLRFVRERC